MGLVNPHKASHEVGEIATIAPGKGIPVFLWNGSTFLCWPTGKDIQGQVNAGSPGGCFVSLSLSLLDKLALTAFLTMQEWTFAVADRASSLLR